MVVRLGLVVCVVMVQQRSGFFGTLLGKMLWLGSLIPARFFVTSQMLEGLGSRANICPTVTG